MEDLSFAPLRFGLQFWENAFALAADSLHSFSSQAHKPADAPSMTLAASQPNGLADVMSQQIRMYRDQTEQSVASARAIADNLRHSMFDGMAAVCSAAGPPPTPPPSVTTPEPTSFRSAA